MLRPDFKLSQMRVGVPSLNAALLYRSYQWSARVCLAKAKTCYRLLVNTMTLSTLGQPKVLPRVCLPFSALFIFVHGWSANALPGIIHSRFAVQTSDTRLVSPAAVRGPQNERRRLQAGYGHDWRCDACRSDHEARPPVTGAVGLLSVHGSSPFV